MTSYTIHDVEAYLYGLMTDPKERAAIEHARELDPLVHRWFARLSDDEASIPQKFREQARQIVQQIWPQINPAMPLSNDGKVHRKDRGYYSKQLFHSTTRGDSKPRPPKIWVPTELPCHDIDAESGLVRFAYLGAETAGVARVTTELEGEVISKRLVVFQQRFFNEDLIRLATAALSDFGVPVERANEVAFYVVFATSENRDQFSQAELESLLGSCNGDSEGRETIERVINELKGKDRS